MHARGRRLFLSGWILGSGTLLGLAALPVAGQEGEADPRVLLSPAPAAPRVAPADPALLAAAGAGAVAEVEARLAAGAPVDGRGAHGRTALMEAVGAGHREAAARLLTAGADLETPDDSGNTALFFAAAAGGEMVRWLLDQGALATVRNKAGFTPLRSAALLGELAAVEALLAAGVAAEGMPGVRGPLEEAVLAHHFPVAERLRAAGARLDRSLGEDGSLLHLAARRGSRPALDYLLDHGVEPAKGSPELPPGFPAPIHAATAAGRSVAVVRLLAAGAAAEALDEKGRTPLQVAVAKGDLEVLTALLEGGASPDHTGREEHRNPPLVLAAMLGQRAAAERLLAAGARGDGSNRNRVTALMFASYRGDGPLVKALLLAGVEVDARNRDGNTALLFAAVRSRGEILDLLLQRGADPDVRAFIDAFGEVTPLLLAAGRGEAENVRRLLEGGASVDAAGDVEGHGVVTPLLLAAARGFPEVVALLLAHGADPHRRDDGGHTALDRARQGGHAAVAELLEGAKATSGPAS